VDIDIRYFKAKVSRFLTKWKSVPEKVENQLRLIILYTDGTIIWILWSKRVHGSEEVKSSYLIEAHKIHGNKWAEIAEMIPGRYSLVYSCLSFQIRTDNAVKRSLLLRH